MSPSPLVDSLPPPDNQQVDVISLLIAALDVIPNSDPIDGPGQPVDWRDLVVGEQYWGQVTGFGSDGSVPRRFTVTEISRFPDGGAMIWTDVPAIAWGVGGACESLVGPRNRFWRYSESQT
jgi:hypothetical protein